MTPSPTWYHHGLAMRAAASARDTATASRAARAERASMLPGLCEVLSMTESISGNSPPRQGDTRFGITTDFRTRLFPGSQRLIELADRIEALQVEALCWCGARATHNARTVDGAMVVEGAQVVVGDVRQTAEVGYEVLCRRHHLRRMTSATARAGALSPDVLPVAPTPRDATG